MKIQRLAVQAAALQKHPAEAEVVLRMCVIANAITAIGRTFDRPSSEMVSASEQRDLVCRWVLVGSYLNEAVIILNKRHDGLAWKLAATSTIAPRFSPRERPASESSRGVSDPTSGPLTLTPGSVRGSLTSRLPVVRTTQCWPSESAAIPVTICAVKRALQHG